MFRLFRSLTRRLERAWDSLPWETRNFIGNFLDHLKYISTILGSGFILVASMAFAASLAVSGNFLGAFGVAFLGAILLSFLLTFLD